MQARIAQDRDRSFVHSPFPEVLLVGASDAEADEIESFCNGRNIRVSPQLIDPVAERGQIENGDVVIWSLEALDNESVTEARKLRSFGLPILCILPPGEIVNTDLLSELTVDDFVFRPYRSEQLLYRLRVLLNRRRRAVSSRFIEKRRRERRQSDQKVSGSKATLLTRNSLIIDPSAKRVILNGKEIGLSPREYSLLSLLGSQPGRVVSHKEIIEHIWCDKKRANAADVQQYIYLLRKKIEPEPGQPRWIISVKGFGYKLNVPSG